MIKFNSKNRLSGSGGMSNRPSHKKKYTQTQTNYPTTVLNFFHKNYKSKHPTQKPVELLEYLIKTYSKESEIVLDNTMGSGSTGIACINTNRKFIGIEKDAKYFDIACKRIEEAYKLA
jgi:site-specific DNA-methyltransferase (adenine-specific)